MRKDPMAHPKANPIASAEQYGLMAAIASGATLRQDVGISQELAREMIRKTPRRLRSKFAAELAKKRQHNTSKADWETVLHKHGYKHEESGKYQGREFHRYVHPSGPNVVIGALKSGSYGAQVQGQFGSKETPAGLESILTYLKVNPSSYKRNNPSAEELTETWHGRPPNEVIDYEEVETHESDAAVLAELEELAIILDNHEDTICIEFGEDPPMLVANVATDTLEVLGGDQHLEFGEGWDTTKSEISLGHVYLIAYCTDKHHLEGSNGRPESYEHFFGEEYYKGRGYKVSDYKDTAKATASEQFFDDVLEDGVVEDAIVEGYLPVMIYDTVNEKVRLVGGRYTVEDVGLKD